MLNYSTTTKTTAIKKRHKKSLDKEIKDFKILNK